MSSINISIKNPLVKEQGYINGQWVSADSGKTFSVTNPATGDTIADIPDMGASDTEKAISAADKAFKSWGKTLGKERYTILTKWASLVRQNKEALAKLLTEEQGKPLAESLSEVDYAMERIEWGAEDAKRISGAVVSQSSHDIQSVTLKQPVGVVATVTPWNFPIGMICAKFSAALAAGCTIVAKPAETTPLTALALVQLAAEAGVPAGVINMVTTNQPAEVGNVITQSPVVRKLSFTGSTATGKLLAAQAASTAKNVTLEMGGNAPFIVFEDADLDQAVASLRGMKFFNAGQICVCPNRIMVHDKVYDEFVSKIKDAMNDLCVGDGADAKTNVGPLNNQKSYDKTARLVKSAVDSGAKVLVGGKPHSKGGTFYEPTLLVDVTRDMDIANDEIFGPVIAMYRFTDEADVLEFANDTHYGLAGYFFTSDISRSWRVGRALEYGTVVCNSTSFGNIAAPFGGVKQSGIGREGGSYAIEEYLEVKHFSQLI